MQNQLKILANALVPMSVRAAPTLMCDGLIHKCLFQSKIYICKTPRWSGHTKNVNVNNSILLMTLTS